MIEWLKDLDAKLLIIFLALGKISINFWPMLIPLCLLLVWWEGSERKT